MTTTSGLTRIALAEFRDIARHQLQTSETFIHDVEDLPVYDEFHGFLTHAEMEREFRRVLKWNED